MKERPIIFSTEMVQAILAGRKTMTRRTQGLEEINEYPDEWLQLDQLFNLIDSKGRLCIGFRNNNNYETLYAKCPYGNSADQLWVRETFMRNPNHDIMPPEYYYKASVSDQFLGEWKGCWKPSIHMPRLASRIDLLNKSIRVERLQDISQEDARKEGVYCSESPIGPCYLDYLSGQCNAMTTAKMSFFSLWRKINGEESLASNPWVWVIEFERLT